MDRLESQTKFHLLKNESGQSTVEYIMLLAVVIFLVSSVLNSDYFREFFGAEGKFATTFRQEVEFSYRHALGGREYHSDPNYQSYTHPSYVGGEDTRFFGAKDPYPR